MFVKRTVKWSRLALGALGSVGGPPCVPSALLSALPVQPVHAQSAPACAAAWSAGTVYTGGNTASENGINYKANWWTQGDDPATHNGGPGSGQPWTSQGVAYVGRSATAAAIRRGGDPAGYRPIRHPRPDDLLFSPYKDVTINLNWNTNTMRTAAATGSPIPVVGSGSLVSNYVPNLGAITLAFASGECGSENWGGISAASFASANIQALANAGVNYVVSTGGQAGSFTCGRRRAWRSSSRATTRRTWSGSTSTSRAARPRRRSTT